MIQFTLTEKEILKIIDRSFYLGMRLGGEFELNPPTTTQELNRKIDQELGMLFHLIRRDVLQIIKKGDVS